MSAIITLIEQVESLVANGGTASEIKDVLSRLRDHCGALEESNANLRKELEGFWEFHTEDKAKDQKRHDEQVERMAADIAELKFQNSN